MLFQMVASFIPAIWGKPVNRCPIQHVAVLLNSKQVDSLQIPGAPGLPERKHFPNTQPKMVFTFSGCNFATLNQMHLSAECHWDTTQGLQELVLKRHTAHQEHGIHGVLCLSPRPSWSEQICSQGLVIQLVWIQLLFFRSVLSSFV